jgi:hypothetical protein
LRDPLAASLLTKNPPFARGIFTSRDGHCGVPDGAQSGRNLAFMIASRRPD